MTPRRLALAAILLAACATPEARTPGQPGIPQPGIYPRGRGSPGPMPSGPPGRVPEGTTSIEEVCRTQIPGGWAAIRYVPGGGRCTGPVGEDGDYTAAVVRRLDGLPVGVTLSICADQAVPRGWYVEGDGEGACPGARVGEGKPTTIRIRRGR